MRSKRFALALTARRWFVVVVLGLVLAAASSARADRRSYLWSYGYMTTPPGEMELEYYVTSETPDSKLPGQTDWEHRLELEAGLTDRFDFAVYQIFSQPADGAFHYDAFQFRTRYRLGEPGQWVVDPLIYLEYRRPSALTLPNELEAKLILSRDFERVNAVVNLIEEIAFAPGSEAETEYSAGLSFEAHPVVHLGVELFGDLATPEDDPKAHFFGPTISLARDRWYYTVGVAMGLNKDSDDVRARAILGIGL